MNDEKFIEKQLENHEFYDTTEKIINESIQFGRDNPETCEILHDKIQMIYFCNKCNQMLDNTSDMNFCPYCGRKIIYESKIQK